MAKLKTKKVIHLEVDVQAGDIIVLGNGESRLIGERGFTDLEERYFAIDLDSGMIASTFDTLDEVTLFYYTSIKAVKKGDTEYEILR